MKFAIISIFFALAACTTAPKTDANLRQPSSAAPADLKKLKVYEVSDLEEAALNEILSVAGLNQFKAQVRIIDPVRDPYGAFEAALKPIAGLLEITNAYNPKLTHFVPREVNYFTRKGHGLVTSCYVYLYQSKPPSDRIFINSRQCNLTWPGIEQIEGGKVISQFFSGVVSLGEGMKVTGAKFIPDSNVTDAQIERFLAD